MTVLWILLVSAAVLVGGGWGYSRLLSQWVGEDPRRTTPAFALADGRDYVATPTPVVFAHHFASIAGAGPIVGPVLAIVYGWLPALLWVLLGGLFFGAVHDYLATLMSLREGGQSVATILRNLIGRKAFIAFVLFLVIMLALVTAMFLNLSAAALVSTVEMPRLQLSDPGIFRVVQRAGPAGEIVPHVVIGGIASASVIFITAMAPLVGFLYIKRSVAVWKCSLLAVAICGAAIVAGAYFPVNLSPRVWQLALSAYVLIAAGAPVWLFLQSRDFINVHILYVGMTVLVVILVAAAVTGAHLSDADQTFATKDMSVTHGVQAVTIRQGEAISGLPLWPMLFITVACGAVSGFHSLCAGGTTCKQLTSERAARHVGFYAMLLETFVAVCVIAVCVVGLDMLPYLNDVHPKVLNVVKAQSNPVLAFAMAVGWTGHLALGIPIVWGALAGMILLEGFLVTTLDTAIRLTRYLLEEVWRALLLRFDVFAPPVAPRAAQDEYGTGERTPLGADGIPIAPAPEDSETAPPAPRVTTGALRWGLTTMRHYWFNSGLAVGLMLLFAFTGGAKALWSIFATANQLLAAFVLLLAGLWLLRRGKRSWFAFVPAVLMLATTFASLLLLLRKFLADPWTNATLLAADVAILVLAAYLLLEGATSLAGSRRRKAPAR